MLTFDSLRADRLHNYTFSGTAFSRSPLAIRTGKWKLLRYRDKDTFERKDLLTGGNTRVPIALSKAALMLMKNRGKDSPP